MASQPDPTDDQNPYAAPLAEIGAPAPDFEQFDSADEALRRRHLNHEARVRSIGFLGFAGMVFWALYGSFLFVAGIVMTVLVLTSMAGRLDRVEICLGIGGAGVGCLAVAFGCFALARGLRRLRSWARWTWAVLFGLPMAGVCIAGVVCPVLWVMGQLEISLADIRPILAAFGFYFLLPGWLLYVLMCRESRVIFTPEYRAVVERTPHIKYKMGKRTKWIAMLVVIAVIAVLIIMTLTISG